jgi:drug/metabolite transporter (DMT)-like permease|tara:strand:+ start:238 stop:1236 length:999 start_codon:yes stop_codon:yes gene_type:complete
LTDQWRRAGAIRAPNWVDTARLFALGAIWGSAFLSIEIGLESMGPFTLTASRLVLSAGLLLGLMALARLPFPRQGWVWRRLALVSLFNAALPFALISWGQQSVDSAMAAVLMGAGPLIGLILNHLFTGDDRMSAAKVLGVSLGFVGVLLLFGEEAWAALQAGWRGGLNIASVQALGGAGGVWAGVLGQLAIVGGAASYALSGLLTRRLSHLDTRVAAASMLLLSTLYFLPLAFWAEGLKVGNLTGRAIVAVLFLGLVASGFAALMRFQLIKDTGAVFMSQVSYLVPVFGVAFSALFFLRAPQPQTLAALLLILCGVAVSRIRKKSQIFPPGG